MTRVRVALVAVIVAALLPAMGILTQVASRPELLDRRDDPVSMFERHVAPLRDALGNERIVGYLASPQMENRAAHLYSLRYALAPVQVRDGTDLSLVVADSVVEGQQLPPQLRIRRDFGDGLLLLERVE